MANAALRFLPAGTPGINLLKLHGVLDVFAFGDSNDLIKLKPAAPTFDAIIDALQIANEGVLDPKPSISSPQRCAGRAPSTVRSS